MNGDVAGIELQSTVHGQGRHFLGGKIAVFDHSRFPVDHADHADALPGIRLTDDLGRHLRPGHDVIPHESRIGDVRQGIVHLEVENLLDAPRLHVFERPALVKRGNRSTVPVGIHEKGRGRLQDISALRRHRRDLPLAEELHPVPPQSEVNVLLEKFYRLAVIRPPGHDIPGDHHVVLSRQRHDLLGKELEEGLLPDRRHWKHSFRSVETESGGLASRDEKHTDFTPGDDLLPHPERPESPLFLIVGGGQLDDGRRFQTLASGR